MNKYFPTNLVLVLIIAVTFPLGVNSAEIDGKYFSESIRVENKTLNIAGSGLLRYWGFKAYVGALYLEEGCKIEDALSDKAKRLEIEYLRPIRGQDFGAATDKSIAKNVDQDTYKMLLPRIQYQSSLYEDVQPGDRYSLTYIPGKGTELALNGEPKGIVEGADFAAAVFSIWLGPEPINKSFKKQILGL